jgi:ADP-heptose:LPS heptosyltransferase
MKIRISVIRPDHLGDHVLFSGAWKHLQKRWPEAEIILYAPKFAINLLEHCPYIRSIRPSEQLEEDALCRKPLRWVPQFRESGSIARAIQLTRRQFARGNCNYKTDILLLPLRTPLRKYHHLVRYIPSRIKIGIDNQPRGSTSIVSCLVKTFYTSRMEAFGLPKDFPELELNRLFLNFLGCDVPTANLWPEFWTTSADRQFAEDWLPRDGGLVFGLAPGVPARKDKQLPPGWFADTFRSMSNHKCRLVFFGTAAESEYIQAVINELSRLDKFTEIKNLAGRTTPRQLVECVRNCDLVLSQETGFLHIAVALRKHALGLIGGGYFNRFFPWGEPDLVHPIFNQMDCFNCDWICKYDTLRCLQEISPSKASISINAALANVAKASSTA